MKKIIVIILIFIAVFAIIHYHNQKQDIVNIIKNRGVIFIGTTGDYLPMSYYDKEKNVYVGFDIALAEDLAKSLNVKIKYINTTWSNLMQDTVNNKFDAAVSGITITDERKKIALMSKGYLKNGKTILCRKEYNDNNYKNINLISFAGQIINLFNKMKNLQENISLTQH